jgi:hypothetical protein
MGEGMAAVPICSATGTDGGTAETAGAPDVLLADGSSYGSDYRAGGQWCRCPHRRLVFRKAVGFRKTSCPARQNVGGDDSPQSHGGTQGGGSLRPGGGKAEDQPQLAAANRYRTNRMGKSATRRWPAAQAHARLRAGTPLQAGHPQAGPPSSSLHPRGCRAVGNHVR